MNLERGYYKFIPYNDSNINNESLENWEEEFEDTYTCNYDDLLEEELGLVFDNRNITKLFFDYITGGKVKIKARKGKIVIESIGE